MASAGCPALGSPRQRRGHVASGSLPPLVHEYRQVGIGGQRERAGPERFPQEHRFRRRRKVLLRPDDVAYPHLPIVDDTGQDEQRVTVRLRDHEVVDRRVRKTNLSANDVVHDRHAFPGNPEP